MNNKKTVSIEGKKFFCSWSGGKDSCLAFYRAVKMGGSPSFIFTMLDESGKRSRSHALPRKIFEEQAQSIGIKCLFRSATWEGYEKAFISGLRELKKNKVKIGVFGDIDLQEHLDWVQTTCAKEGFMAVEPLWKNKRKKLLNEFINAGFKARIIAVNTKKMSKKFLGKMITKKLILELEKSGIDPSGENGEYHTVVTDGPIFRKPIKLKKLGIKNCGQYSFLKVTL